MFDSHLKSTGRDFVATVALLAVAFVFSPVLLIASRPFGNWSIPLGIACSALTAAWAWVQWQRSSKLFVPSIEAHSTRGE